MKKSSVVLSCALALSGMVEAADCYLKLNATDLSVASSYTSDPEGKIDCTQPPTSSDRIILPANSTYAVDGASASFATLAGCQWIRPNKGATLMITVAKENRARLTAPFYYAVENSAVRTYGTIVKLGEGELVLGPETQLANTTENGYRYASNAEVREGILRYPEDILANSTVGNVTISDGATVFMPKSANTASQIYFNHLYAAPGSLITNDTTRGITTGHVIGITQYSGYKPEADSEIAGLMAGGVRIWSSNGNLLISGTNNTIQPCTTTAGGGAAGRYAPCGVGTILVNSFGASANKPSSIGCHSAFMVHGSGGGFRYLGEGETTSKSIQLYQSRYPAFLDAGPVGNLTITGALQPYSDSADNAVVKVFHFSGSNRNESVWSGSCFEVVKDGVSYPLYLGKTGSGTWRLAHNESRWCSGGVTVADGTLRFDTLEERGVMCAFGLATNLTAEAYDAVKKGNYVDYAFTLGGKTAENAVADPVMEFSGSASAACHTRPLVLAEGGGRLRNDSPTTRLAFYGVSARDAKTNPTLTLDGAGTAGNTVGDITNGLGTVSVTKRGSGTWRLARELSFSGDLKVEEGTLEIEKNVSTNFTWFRYTICQLGKGAYNVNRTTVNMRELALYDATGTRQNVGLQPVYPDPYPTDTTSYLPALDAALDLKPGEVSYARTPGVNRATPAYKHQPLPYNSSGSIDLEGYFSGLGKTIADQPHKYTITFEKAPRLTVPSTWIPIVMRLGDGVPPITHFDLQVMSNYSTSSCWPNYVIWEGSTDGVHWHTIFDNRGEADGFKLDRTYVNEKGELCGLGASTDKYTTYVCNLWMSDMLPYTGVGVKRPYPQCGYAFASTGVDEAFSQLENVRSVSVAQGATLKAIGGLTLDKLDIDASGAGTFDGFAFAEAGVIDVKGADLSAGDIELPATFSNCTDLENVRFWTVRIGGTEKKGRVIEVRNGKLHLVRLGLSVIVR